MELRQGIIPSPSCDGPVIFQLDNLFNTFSPGFGTNHMETCLSGDYLRVTQANDYEEYRCGRILPTQLPDANANDPILTFFKSDNSGQGTGFKLLACQSSCPLQTFSGISGSLALGLGSCFVVQTSTFDELVPYPSGESFSFTVLHPQSIDFRPSPCSANFMTVQFSDTFDTTPNLDTVIITTNQQQGTPGGPFSGPGVMTTQPGTQLLEFDAPNGLTLTFTSLAATNDEHVGFSATICAVCPGLAINESVSVK